MLIHKEILGDARVTCKNVFGDKKMRHKNIWSDTFFCLHNQKHYREKLDWPVEIMVTRSGSQPHPEVFLAPRGRGMGGGLHHIFILFTLGGAGTFSPSPNLQLGKNLTHGTPHPPGERDTEAPTHQPTLETPQGDGFLVDLWWCTGAPQRFFWGWDICDTQKFLMWCKWYPEIMVFVPPLPNPSVNFTGGFHHKSTF